MGTDALILILPLLLLAVPAAFVRLRKKSDLVTERQGPLATAEALDQLLLLFVIYFVLLLVPIGGKLAGPWGQPISLLILFTILVSLLVRFKKLGDE
jgi:cytochrome b561